MTKTIADGIISELGKQGDGIADLKAAGAQRQRSTEDTTDITADLAALEHLEEMVEEEAAVEQTATEKLGAFRLSRLELGMLDAAIVNVAENKGVGITDEKQKQAVVQVAQLFTAAGHDLSKAIDFVIAGAESTAAPGLIYKLCFAVQKALLYSGNFMYRKALDPTGDFDLEKYVDYREEQRTAPYGLEPITDIDHDGRERELDDPAMVATVRGSNGRIDPEIEAYQVVERALENLHIYLQLVTEAFGWDPENPMPYCYIMQKDETFRPIYDLQQALDLQEIKTKEARTRRQERAAANMAAALAAAQSALKKAAVKA